MKLMFDIETDDIKATKIWCIVCQDIDTDKIYKFDPSNIDEGLKLLQSADTIIGHNIIGFDIPVIKDLTGVDLNTKKIIDTLVMSRLYNPVRDGGHGLEMWGYRLKFPKIDYKEFKHYSEEMLNYCVNDVKLNTVLYRYLLKEGQAFATESLDIEHEVFKIMKQQEVNGFKFNSVEASIFLATLREKIQEIEKEVQKVFVPKLVDIKEVIPKIKKDGDLSKQGLTQEEYDDIIKTGNKKPFIRRKLVDFNLGSRKQIGEYLIEFGWKPDKFTPTGQPIVDEGTLSRINNIPEAKLIAEYLLLQKRIAQISSWLEAVQDDERVHGFVIPNGTITGRMTHRNPNMAQVPSITSEYGTECRSFWCVEEGYKLVGIDASQLELRLLAHYMNDEEYTYEITKGDIHTHNQNLAGLKSRDEAKVFIYALCYGAGNAKLGKMVGGNAKRGGELRERFFGSQPAFATLTDQVQRATKKGYLKGLDGRKLFVRSEHSALNTLIQGAGSIAMKKGLVILNKKLRLNGIDYKFVANIHDEWQVEVKESQADFVGRIAVESIIKAGDYFNLRCPLDGEYKIGNNWYETH
jgi:DNA polymerase I-like protein with 3'-5' exonuclease and polymerase domains|tara:strand:- start:1630 stop:3360 length:1731 start_codon:yes stop_codon:yes gene_type:complete